MIDTNTRPGRMLQAMLESANPRAAVILTATVSNGARRYHEVFKVSKWEGRSGPMLRVEIHKSGDWDHLSRSWGERPIVVGFANAYTGRYSPSDDARAQAPLVQYAARVVVHYLGTGAAPKPANGQVEVLEETRCACCQAPLSDPESIERGVGPECAGRATRSRTIRSRERDAAEV